jgi:NAD-dependent oxidoreductase involved in siderophore biosynthesis
MRNAPFGAFLIADIPYSLQLQIYLTPTNPAWIDSYKINIKIRRSLGINMEI